MSNEDNNDNDHDHDHNLDDDVLINEVPDIKDESKKIEPKKKILIIIIIISSVLILIAIGITLFFLLKDKNKENNKEEDDPNQIPISEENYFDQNEVIKNYTINSNAIKLGIISDFQLNKKYPNYDRNLKNTLKKLKEENVDIIIMAGDIVDTGYQSEYDQYKNILNSVYTDNSTKPLIFEIMGNHEYYATQYKIPGYSLKKNIQLFKDNFNKYPFYHIKINNYHFIFWSMQNYDKRENYTIHTNWLQKHIEIAENDLQRAGDPIFIITHLPPKNTVYGSEDTTGSITAYNVLKNYENIFCISGHSHRSLRNERSIWQGEFTAINTQSTSYMALARKFTNTSAYVEKSIDSYMGDIAILSEEKLELHRYYFHINKEIGSWIVRLPLQKSNFDFNVDKRKMIFGTPIIWNNTITVDKINNSYQAKYYQAWHKLATHHYVFRYTNINKENKEVYIYGDYYLYNYINNSNEPKYFTISDIDIKENYSLSAFDFFENEAKY